MPHYRIAIEPEDPETAQAIKDRAPGAHELLEAKYPTRRCANIRLGKIEWLASKAGITIAGSTLTVREH